MPKVSPLPGSVINSYMIQGGGGGEAQILDVSVPGVWH